MTDKKVGPPKQRNYQQAFDLACAALREMELHERAERAGANYSKGEEGEKVRIPFFFESYEIRLPQVEFYSPSQKAVSLVSRVLMLHYLLRADGTPVSGRWVAYKEVPGALLYGAVFARRVTEPLEKKFGRSARLFREAGLRLGGEPGPVGDASLFLRALPRVPLQLVLWEGDEEFPPKVQFLFDSTVHHYLPLEDMVVLGQMAAGRMIHQLTHVG